MRKLRMALGHEPGSVNQQGAGVPSPACNPRPRLGVSIICVLDLVPAVLVAVAGYPSRWWHAGRLGRTRATEGTFSR
jgi:hypothetical protein